VTSDHGESLGDHGTFAGHGLLWESGLRVPLLVKLPSSHPQRERWRGARIPYRVQSVDLAPTILSVAGLRLPSSFQGKSLLIPGDRVVFAYRGSSALIDGRYKLKGPGSRSDTLALLDLAVDPHEIHPIQAERSELLREMQKKSSTLLAELRETQT
jgi:arylsulfatase A-like enzyme